MVDDNSNNPLAINYGDIRFPKSGAIAPDALLPLAFGQVRVGGIELKLESVPGQETYHGWGVIPWSEGEIESIDGLVCDGVPLSAYTNDFGTLSLSHFTGAPGDYRQDATSDIFCPYPRTNPGVGSAGPYDTSNFGAVAYTRIDILTSIVMGRLWWSFLPSGNADLVHEWAVDMHALKLYDPRTGLTVYSNNPALIARYLLKKVGKLLDSEIDDTSIGNAADACDSAGFTCNIVFSAKTTLTNALAAVLQTCNGILTNSNGKRGLFIDVVNPSAPVATLSEEDGDIWGLKYEWLSARDRYTRLAVSFFNAAANKNDQTPDRDHPGIALGTTPIKPLVVNAPGINTLAAAVVLRDYLFNSQAIAFRVSGGMSSRGILLEQGMKVLIKTLKDVSFEASILQVPGNAQGFFSFVAKPYDAAVFDSTPITQGPPIFGPPPAAPLEPPDVYARIDSSVWPTGAKIRWEPRSRKPVEFFGSAYWTNVTSFSAYDVSKINDGDLAAYAVGFDGAGLSQSVTFDSLGGGAARRRFVAVRFVYDPSVTVTRDLIAQRPELWYSDPDAWTQATAREGGVGILPANYSYIWIGGVLRGFEFEFNDVGAQRYWQLRGGSVLAQPDQKWSEIQFIEADGTAWTDSQIDHYEVHARSTPGEPTTADPTVAIIPSASRPTLTSYLDLSPFSYQTGATDSFGSLYSFLTALIVTVFADGRRSAGSGVDTFFYAYSAAGGAITIPLVDHTIISPPAAGFAGLVISSVDGKLYKAVAGGGWADVSGGGGGSGTVTSVAQTAPSDLLAVSGSPVTGAGTLALAKVTVPKNKFLAGPSSGADADWSFRELVSDDLVGVAPNVMVERPAGDVDGSNKHFVLSKLPTSSRILFIADNMPLNSGIDYTRSGVDVFLVSRANAPRKNVMAVYPYQGSADPHGTPETPVPGTATTWTGAAAAARKWWKAICYDPDDGILVAVGAGGAGSGTSDAAVMLSSDGGATWSSPTIPGGAGSAAGLNCVAYSPKLGMIATVSDNGTATTGNNGLYSTDGGATWTVLQTGFTARGIVWAADRFVAVGGVGAYSLNGTTWTACSIDAKTWTSVCYSPELHRWVAVASNGALDTVATSEDGATFTTRNGASASGGWLAVRWANKLGLFVAVGSFGSMSSPDGITWTFRTTANDAYDWRGLAWSQDKGLLVAVGSVTLGGTDKVMVSSDGTTWTGGTSITDSRFYAVAADDPQGVFVAVAADDTTNQQVMISAS